MKIFFSPSEEKRRIESKQLDTNLLKEFFIPFEAREQILTSYINVLQKGSDEEICKLFGVKSLQKYLDDLADCNQILTAPRTEAIRLYNGVAYKALDFNSLEKLQQDYLLQNVFIFSNLFGVVRAFDKIPFYRFNQGYSRLDLGIKKLYQMMKIVLDSLFDEEEDILDLRAEIYIKSYKLQRPYYTIEFLKNKKRISHYAKHYRGLFLRKIAEKQIVFARDIEKLTFDILELKSIVKDDLVTKLIYEIKD